MVGKNNCFPAESIRIRATCIDQYLVGGGVTEAGFVDIRIEVSSQRSEEERLGAGRRVFDMLQESVAHLLAATPLGLSVQVTSSEKVAHLKFNNYQASAERTHHS